MYQMLLIDQYAQVFFVDPFAHKYDQSILLTHTAAHTKCYL